MELAGVRGVVSARSIAALARASLIILNNQLCRGAKRQREGDVERISRALLLLRCINPPHTHMLKRVCYTLPDSINSGISSAIAL
jgi:hypothetical protein